MVEESGGARRRRDHRTAPTPFVIEAISGQDFAIVRSMVFLGALLYILSYVLIDVAYTWADPRVRLS